MEASFVMRDRRLRSKGVLLFPPPLTAPHTPHTCGFISPTHDSRPLGLALFASFDENETMIS